MKPLIECVANISEGRRLDVVQAVADAVEGIQGVSLLDIHTDADHNRSVLTFVGDPQPVKKAAFQLIKTSAVLIKLEEHKGQHPRIGAADVVPFVPLNGASMSDCIEIAHQLGKRVGDELALPVYLYEQAALRPERENLASFRKLGYEALRERAAVDETFRPDCGPLEFGSAGAVAIGARQVLVAYNVFLNTSDVGIAKDIARKIRYSSGGLEHVKALGMLVDGQAQVSMNLTDITRTPIYRVQEMIRREAEILGCTIARSEVVGLIPEQALIDAAISYLQLEDFDASRILERRIRDVLNE